MVDLGMVERTSVPAADVLNRHRGLNEKQREFLIHVLDGESPKRASELAGFAGNSWLYLMRVPAVAAALHEAVQHSLQSDSMVNLKVLRKIRDDDQAPKGVRADIALKLMRMAGHIEPTTRDQAPEKQLSEMSGEELRSYIERNQAEIDRIEGELAARAMDVSAPDSAPKDPPAKAKPLDYLG